MFRLPNWQARAAPYARTGLGGTQHGAGLSLRNEAPGEVVGEAHEHPHAIELARLGRGKQFGEHGAVGAQLERRHGAAPPAGSE